MAYAMNSMYFVVVVILLLSVRYDLPIVYDPRCWTPVRHIIISLVNYTGVGQESDTLLRIRSGDRNERAKL